MPQNININNTTVD